MNFEITTALNFLKQHDVASGFWDKVNPFTPKSDFIDFTLSNARRFYLSKGDPLGVKGLKNYLP